MFPKPRLSLYTTFQQYFFVFNPFHFIKNNFSESRINIDHFKNKLGDITDKKYVIPVNQARVGLYLTMKYYLGKSNKKEVLLSPYTITEVISMVVCAGGKPIFCDIDRKTCNISLENIKNKINDKTGLVLVTHFYGKICDVINIKKIVPKGIPIIEDCAQSFTGQIKNHFSGTMGSAGVYSFGLYKNINAFYGGAIVTDDKNLNNYIQQEIYSWSDVSFSYFYKKVINGLIIDTVTSRFFYGLFFFYFFRWAFKNNIELINNQLKIDVNPTLLKKFPDKYKYRLSDKQAYLIVQQLESCFVDTKKRIINAKMWIKYLSPIKKHIILPEFNDDFSHTYWYFPIQYDDRKELVKWVQKNGYDISESYHRNCAELICFSKYKARCENSHKTAKSLIYLPCYPSIKETYIRNVSKIIVSFFTK